jgi:hypothetical protein
MRTQIVLLSVWLSQSILREHILYENTDSIVECLVIILREHILYENTDSIVECLVITKLSLVQT